MLMVISVMNIVSVQTFHFIRQNPVDLLKVLPALGVCLILLRVRFGGREVWFN